ncbi:MAG TPA: DNA methyltransferase [Candidatus Paceibacterota bacterium]|jgi:DNA modification methylase|nr:DNA methyltransferase [Candidatus Paceibacterota bacterium]
MSKILNSQLTKKQAQLFDYLDKFQQKNSYSPALSDIAGHFNVSIPTAHQHVDYLERKGYLVKEKGVKHSIRLLKSMKDLMSQQDTMVTPGFILPVKNNLKEKGKVSDYLNKVYNGDVMHVLKNLPDNSVDMIFGDPDYNVGIKYNENNYTRKFEDYINWYIELTKESMRVLKPDGNLFMLNYPKQNAHLRVKYLDLLFPNINEYVWVYNTNVGHTPRRFTTAHRSILHVRKSAHNKFFKDAVALPYKNPTDKRVKQNIANGSKGRMPYSWFEFNLVKNVSKEKTNHACQIPQKLTEMLIKGATKPKDTVFVLFGGSGAEIDVCKKLNRNFISAEIDKKYCDIINDRLKKGYIDETHKLGPRGKKIA